MSSILTLSIVSLSILTVNCTVMFFAFPCRFKPVITAGIIAGFTALLFSLIMVTGLEEPMFGGLRGLAYLPLIIYLFKGSFFHKIYAFMLQMLLICCLLFISTEVISLFFGKGSAAYNITLVSVLLSACTIYMILLGKFGRQVLEKLFANSRPEEWVKYSLGAIFSFAIMAISMIADDKLWQHILLLLYVLWSFCMLCFVVINTHEKTKQRYEAEFARNIISSGRDHYQKMDRLRDELRILRHDYKYHLNATRKMLMSGETEKADQYLLGIEKQLPGFEQYNYCTNSVLNALVASYAERCEGLAIKFDAKLDIPETLTLPNFDLCIVLGNLLENAVEACEKQQSNRRITLVISPQGSQIVIVVRNSFDGHVVQEAGKPVSMKNDGGLGLRSIQAVAARYGGEMLTEWDETIFTAYVYLG